MVMKSDHNYPKRITNLNTLLPIKVLESIKQQFGYVAFSRQSILELIIHDYGDIPQDEILLANWTVNSITGYEFSHIDDSWHKRHAILFMRSDGLFELYSPSIHGEWTRMGNKCHRTKRFNRRFRNIEKN